MVFNYLSQGIRGQGSVLPPQLLPCVRGNNVFICELIHSLNKYWLQAYCVLGMTQLWTCSAFSCGAIRSVFGLFFPFVLKYSWCMGIPGGSDGKESACNMGDLGFDSWVEKIPWRRESSILAWRIPRTVEPGWLQSMGPQRVGCDWATNTHTHVVDLQSCVINNLKKNVVLVSGIEGSDSDVCVCVFSSIVDYYKILSIVLCATQ